ncbi:MAG: type I DNA topoisomerase [Candidatus Adiutrix sp.]
MNLLIVESPGKVKKIQSFLGNDWKVAASVGHVRDLPKSGENDGICPPDFKANYVLITGKEKVFADLSKLVKDADQIYLATDPDREGEAIAWHLKELLRLKDPHRVTYTEITETAVKKAVSAPRKIDMQLVGAQETRRVLDRLMGYKVRAAINAAANETLTAGRVQSPALRLVVEREVAIRNFISTTHFGVDLIFEAVENISDGWKASWNTKNFLEDGQEYFLDKSIAEKIATLRTFDIVKYEEAESKQAPPAPHTTSTLQQAASNVLKINPKTTMELAQKLYEGGHITYMRTDSPNLSDDAIVAIRSLASKKDWPVPPKARTWKSKDGAQEAHEAIRPTHFEVENAGDTDQQIDLYKLIRLRAVASQLEDAVFATNKAVLETELDGKKVIFEAKGRRLISSGWKVILDGDQTEDPDKPAEPENQIPKLREGAQATALKGDVKTKKTNPPARFSQASLISELEKRGIGRPSTYANILDNITSRSYIVENKKRQIEASPLGELLISQLIGNFAFVDYEFTKNMESHLDEIAAGKNDYLKVVVSANEGLEKELLSFIKTKGLGCSDCGNLVVHLKGTSKKTNKPFDFWVCSNDKCKASFKDDNGKLGPKQELKAQIPLSEHKCDVCGKALRNVVKEGSNGYNFWSCSGFPNCKTSYKNDDGKPGAKNEPKKKGGK